MRLKSNERIQNRPPMNISITKQGPLFPALRTVDRPDRLPSPVARGSRLRQDQYDAHQAPPEVYNMCPSRNISYCLISVKNTSGKCVSLLIFAYICRMSQVIMVKSLMQPKIGATKPRLLLSACLMLQFSRATLDKDLQR